MVIAVIVGIIIPAIAHFRLFVSFFIVRNVVEHGQCNSENTIKHNATPISHPLFMSRSCSVPMLSMPKRVLFDIYDIIMIGITISFAGHPKIKANRITPSSPISMANGSKKLEDISINVAPSTLILAINQITKPAGVATFIALARTNSVLSNIDLTITLPICGRLNGGNSKVKDDGNPFRIVIDNIFDMSKVITTPNIIIAVRKTADINVSY